MFNLPLSITPFLAFAYSAQKLFHSSGGMTELLCGNPFAVSTSMLGFKAFRFAVLPWGSPQDQVQCDISPHVYLV